jgi:hypothetical protein
VVAELCDDRGERPEGGWAYAVTFIPFPEFRPDVDDFRGEHTQVLEGVLPRGDGYGPFPALQNYTGILEHGNDTYTKVLLHFDGTDLGTTITDSNAGGSAHTWTAAGNANTDTAIKKFGTAALLCDGVGDYVSTPDHADFVLGTSDFTVDCWFSCLGTTGGLYGLLGQSDAVGLGGDQSFRIYRSAGNKIVSDVGIGGTLAAVMTSTTSFTDALNTGWHHVAVTREGSTFRLFLDGVEEATATTSSAIDNSTEALTVGRLGSYNAPWLGSVDEFRLSVGIARWTTDFSVELSPYKAESACRGYFTARNPSDGSIAIFAGSATCLYKLNNTTLKWEDVSKGAVAYTTLSSTEHWQFAQYGSVVIAVNGNNAPQAFTVGTSTVFADLAGSPPASRYVAVVARQLVLTGQTSQPRRVSWSDVDDITQWTAGTNFANRVDLPDGGITRGVAGGEFGLIFQEGVIRRMVYVPAATPSFQIERVTEDEGLYAPYSIVRSGGRVAFISQKGFQEYIPGAGLNPIGKERIDRTIMADIDGTKLFLCIGSNDPSSTKYFWAYKSAASSDTEAFDKVIAYDYALKRWSPTVDTNGEYISTMIKPGVTLDALDDVSGSIDDLGSTLDSIEVALTSRLSAFTTDHKLGFFDGDNAEAVLETPEYGGPGRSFIRGFDVRTDATSVYGSLRYRSTPNAVLSETDESEINERGFCPLRVDTKLARARVRIPAGELWNYVMGVEPDFKETGKR